MKPSDLINEVMRANPGLHTNDQIADFLGLTPGRVSQLRKQEYVTPRTLVSAVKKAKGRAAKEALRTAIRPIVEFYPAEKSRTKQNASWEIVPTDAAGNPRERGLRDCLEKSIGVYFFYNSEGEVIYSGKTERQSLWKEMNLAFNRKREAHSAFLVEYPSQGKKFYPAWERPRQPKKRPIFLYDSAKYFSAYQVESELISSVESLIIRSICNDITNVRMETFRFEEEKSAD